ncbi:hypothetical protein BTM25_09790 [Actinomadura rubteroloni]|uniref:Uncharacterized protein n=1 Tax=Actinomadura rubteroloni TaxID=1926885 RepID=A0A2P4UNF2_9ACTN|nr:hypothetical protein [Actinomadura rubteroloni]POM26578.1 hypothetical protein BTM25_09790 [Actinomadura rubteroloni]
MHRKWRKTFIAALVAAAALLTTAAHPPAHTLGGPHAAARP